MTLLGAIFKSGIKVGSSLIPKNKNAFKLQKKAFVKLLTKARYTQFGEKYGFENILSKAIFGNIHDFYEDFKNQVPIYDYNKMYNQWWYKTRANEKNVTWAGKIKHFALSSGTSEAASKAIPVSKMMLKAMQKTSLQQLISLGRFDGLPDNLFETDYLMIGGTTELSEINGHFEGDLSGMTTGNVPKWFESFYKPGKEVSKIRDWESRLEAIVEQAPKWNVGFIAGNPAWLQIILERIIERYQLKNIHELWQNLSVFAWGGVSIEPYLLGFHKLLDENKPLTYLQTYLASEGFLAYQSEPNADMELALNNGIFFEFIPFDEYNFDDEGNLKENPKTLMIDEVKENQEYALLISTCAGAWRYLIGDTIRITNKTKNQIKITGRIKHFLSLCGEHLSVENMTDAIKWVSENKQVEINEFAVCGIETEQGFAHQWYIGTDKEVNNTEIAQLIDQKLCELNDDYVVERQHVLKNVSVKSFPIHVFYDFLAKKGKSGGQHKFPRVLKGALQTEWERFLDMTTFCHPELVEGSGGTKIEGSR